MRDFYFDKGVLNRIDPEVILYIFVPGLTAAEGEMSDNEDDYMSDAFVNPV